jgi:hypothetical protein
MKMSVAFSAQRQELMNNGRGQVLVSYVGGTTDDDEWVSCSTRGGGLRLRPPTDAFSDTTRH